MEPSLNGRIMWAGIKGKVNDVTVNSRKQLTHEMLDGTEVECEIYKRRKMPTEVTLYFGRL